MLKLEKNKHNKKKMYILIVSAFFIFAIAFIIIFSKNNYKTLKNGNNINNQTRDKVYDNILNISSYKATLEVTINSNKNINKYILKQSHNLDEDTQEVLEPENIRGIKTTYNNGILKIQSDNLNITKVYNDYKNIENNDLWLNSFIEDYKISKEKVVEENEEKIISIKVNNRTKKLYLDKKTGKPTKLVVEDNNQKTVIYIIYNEIEINY